MNPVRRLARFPAVALFAGALLLAGGSTAVPSSFPPGPLDLNYGRERALYQEARQALSDGKRDRFAELQRQLVDYPLLGYLDYFDLTARLGTASAAEINHFMQHHGDLPVAPILKNRWLLALGRNHRWQTLIEHYDDQSSVRLQCYHLRALYATGRQAEAFAAVPALWQVGRSQPKACDPLFDAWIAAERLTETMVWNRLGLALQANERRLARYLMRFFSPETERLAESYYRAQIYPGSVADGDVLRHGKRGRDIFLHGLRQLMRNDPEQAESVWSAQQARLKLTPADRREIEEALVLAHARNGRFPDPAATELSPAAVEELATLSIRQADWLHAYPWIERLPEDLRQASEWQYWQARALEETTQDSERARRGYFALAGERNYYGFLAAMRLGLEPSLNHQPHRPDERALAELLARPDVQRGLELYRLEDELNARREWWQLTQRLEPEARRQAAHLAARAGWTFQMIRTANAADLHDSLELRFPAPYTTAFQTLANHTALPVSLLLSVARQESAFDPRARSHADARGLMQLLPSTARLVARRANLRAPRLSDLYVPETNILLGSTHLARLSERYQGSRPLMAAAYNAGEHRVDRWIADASGMPMDVWVEGIPFRETRNYVKNIVAFSHVYSRMLGEPRPVLEPNERRVP